MMGQTLERLFEQKVLTMPKEVSSAVLMVVLMYRVVRLLVYCIVLCMGIALVGTY